MAQNNNTLSGEVGNAAKNAVNVGVRTAKDVKTVSSAAAKAAVGDYAGAALDVLKNEDTRRIIVILIFISTLFSLAIFFAAPLALYEVVNTFWDTLANNFDQWREYYYSGTSGAFGRFLYATGQWAISKCQNLWDSLVSAFQPAAGDVGEELDEADMEVMGEEDSNIETYKAKIDLVKNKVDARANQIDSAVQAQKGAVSGWIASNLYPSHISRFDGLNRSKYWATDTFTDNVVEAVYGGLNMPSAVSGNLISSRSAVDIIALYSVMNSVDPDNIKTYELLRWLGYKGSTSHSSPSFTFGATGIGISVPAWAGDFMPMYLMDEAVLNEEGDYSSYKCPAVDLLLTVNIPDMWSLQPQIEYEEFQHLEWQLVTKYETVATGYTSYREATVNDFPLTVQNCQTYVKYGRQNVDWEWGRVNGMKVKIPLTEYAIQTWIRMENERRAANSGPTYSTRSYQVEEQVYVTRNRAILTYTVYYSIGCRNIKTLIKTAGFVDKPIGDLPPDEQEVFNPAA